MSVPSLGSRTVLLLSNHMLLLDVVKGPVITASVNW